MARLVKQYENGMLVSDRTELALEDCTLEELQRHARGIDVLDNDPSECVDAERAMREYRAALMALIRAYAGDSSEGQWVALTDEEDRSRSEDAYSAAMDDKLHGIRDGD